MLRKTWIAALAVLVLCVTTVCCGSSLKQNVYGALDSIDVSEYSAASIMVPSYDAPSRYTERFPDEYATLAAYGVDGVPYILQYVEQTELDYLNAMFFVCCAYHLLGMDEFLDIDLHQPTEHARALQSYLS